jgi:MFS transporter, MHS family, shikimate and dehydroshikimate transport protein
MTISSRRVLPISAQPQRGAAGEQIVPLRHVVWSSVLGSTVEWYDFFIYGTAAALVFNKLFFPNLSPAVGTIAAFGSYATGFLARPLGGAVFGHFGDRIGRKTMLLVTIILMGIGTFSIGCLPTYGQIGIAAPVLLVALRLIQGIGIGGEWGGAVLMVIESAPNERRGYFGSLAQLGYPLAVIASTAVFALASRLPERDFLVWGWRLPFLLSAILVGIGLFIRLRLEETPAFRQVQAEHAVAKIPLLEILARHPRTFLVAVGLKVSEIAFVSIATVFSINYVTAQLGLSRSTVLNGVLLAAIVELFTIPAFGWLSDLFGRKPLYVAGCLFSIAFAFPMFWLFQTLNPAVIAITIALAVSFGQGIMFGPEAAWVAELFPARLRYSGASLGFQLGAALSGGLTPILASALLLWTGATWSISLYLIAAAIVTLAATFAAHETARQPLN